jgi:hypothetical protein
LFGDFTDAQGEWARFLWYQMPMRPYKIPRHDAAYNLGDLLESIYRKLDSLPELEFYFSKEGQKFYDDWYDKRYEQTRNETRPGLKAAMAKMPGQAARLISVLHVLNGVSSQPPEVQEEISLTTVRAGCYLAQFYLGQATVLQGDGDALHGELTPILKSLLEKLNDIGELNAAQAKRAVWGLRATAPDKIRQHFNELAAMDLAEVQGTGSRLILKSKVLRNVDEKLRNVDEKLRNVDEKLRDSQQHQTYIYPEVQEIKHQTVEEVEAIQIYDTDAIEPSVDEFCNSEKTSTSSTLAEFELESLTQQGEKAVEDSSTISSTVEESSTISSTLPAEFAEQIRNAIANFDRALAVEVTRALKDKTKLKKEVRAALTVEEFENFRLLVTAGFVKGTRVRYIGDPKYAEQFEGLELVVNSIDAHSQISCLKPDGYLTGKLKPEELEAIS